MGSKWLLWQRRYTKARSNHHGGTILHSTRHMMVTVSDASLFIYVIVLAIVLFIVLLAAIIIIILLRKRADGDAEIPMRPRLLEETRLPFPTTPRAFQPVPGAPDTIQWALQRKRPRRRRL